MEQFAQQRTGDPKSQDPVVHDNGVTYLFIKHNNVYLRTASRQNCNTASLLIFLHRFFKHYFEDLEEESLRDNFVVVYELLDEMINFGYPQYTEAKILIEFIKIDVYGLEVGQRPPMAVTNVVSWRSDGIQYKKMNHGQIIRSDVVGGINDENLFKKRTTSKELSHIDLFYETHSRKGTSDDSTRVVDPHVQEKIDEMRQMLEINLDISDYELTENVFGRQGQSGSLKWDSG
ncbi:AP-1 complex subunit mu-2-like [Impatiens glandulifera]|uniref:AP-1 complex subunit mu-2-like n=1 Tax=Impatiens glandulifera TaxID=253017 RepID=UPI001FB10AC8|nr:AP-1 complex subunit mu-2-like [Impatiens glandulifera]